MGIPYVARSRKSCKAVRHVLGLWPCRWAASPWEPGWQLGKLGGACGGAELSLQRSGLLLLSRSLPRFQLGLAGLAEQLASLAVGFVLMTEYPWPREKFLGI